MRPFHHILFPVDFSNRCEAARPFVTSWARLFKAKVTLLHTIQIPISSYGGADGYPLVIDVPGIQAAAKGRLDRFEFADAERIVTTGDPAYEITSYSEKNGVDLIMMPTHGYGPFRSLLLGSTASKVLHDARCPVWTSAHTESPAVHSEVRIVLCAVDGPESEQLVRSAHELANLFHAQLRVIHAVSSPEAQTEIAGEIIRVDQGTASQVVQKTALADRADLVVIGSGKVHETFGRLRSNAYAIIRESPCPVLSMF